MGVHKPCKSQNGDCQAGRTYRVFICMRPFPRWKNFFQCFYLNRNLETYQKFLRLSKFSHIVSKWNEPKSHILTSFRPALRFTLSEAGGPIIWSHQPAVFLPRIKSFEGEKIRDGRWKDKEQLERTKKAREKSLQMEPQACILRKWLTNAPRFILAI